MPFFTHSCRHASVFFFAAAARLQQSKPVQQNNSVSLLVRSAEGKMQIKVVSE